MGLLDKFKSKTKDALLGGLREQMKRQSLKELAEGKLKSPVSLNEVCDRLIPAMRSNSATGMTLSTLKIEDKELRSVIRGALEDAGVEVKE